MNTEKKPNVDLKELLESVVDKTPPGPIPASVAHLFPDGAGITTFQPDLPAPASEKQPQDFAIAKNIPATPAPDPAPLADLEQPVAPESDQQATPAGKRPLAHFGQALPATKSKANRKLVLQLTPEMYQYLAHVSTLPALDGVALPDLVLAVLHAWRADYRPEIKKANAAFKA